MKDDSDEKKDVMILVAMVACTKFGICKLIFFLATVTLITDTWVAISNCVLM